MRNKIFARDSQVMWAAVAATGLHLVLFLYDLLVGFTPFLQGDRAGNRMEVMQGMLAQPAGEWFRAAADAPVVPGEYLLQIPAYLLGGTGGVVLFQAILTILSIACVASIAQRLFSWRFAGLAAALLYMLIPQNIVYPHQFVTEAISTPFCVFFVYFMVRYLKQGAWTLALYAGLCLGGAIFSRPSLAIVIPGLVGLVLIYWRFSGLKRLADLGIMCAAAAAPLAVWVLIFTALTGQVGYTNGVANLSWNLRSKVFLTQTSNGLEKPPEVQGYETYGDLYADTGGIGIGRFVQIASQSPVAYVKAAASDATIVLFKGNSTKLTVDYLGIGRDKGIKDWRNVLEARGIGGLFEWAARNVDALVPFAIEIAFSLLTFGSSLIVIAFISMALIRPAKVTRILSPEHFGVLLVTAALLFAVVISAEMVDRAQARLRHPAEAAMILTTGILVVYLKASGWFLPRTWMAALWSRSSNRKNAT